MKQQSLKIFSKEETGPYELPKGWRWVRLGDKNIAKIIMGQSPPSTTYNQDRIGLPFYQGKTDFGDLYPSPRIWCSIPNKIAESGDILISVRAPVGPVNMCREKSCIGRGLAAIRPTNQIDNFFLFYYFKYIEGTWTGKGSTFGAIKKRELENLQIPLPSLPEQKRIVARIEALFSKIDEIKRLRKEANDLAKTLLQSALHEVFSKADEKGWRWVRLGEVCETLMGGTPRTNIKEYWSEPQIVWVTPEDIKKSILNKVRDSRRKISKKGLEESNAKLLPAGTVLLTTTATIGKVGIAEIDLTTNQQITGIICPKDMFPIFLGYYLLFVGEENLKKLGGAVTATHINQRNLRSIKIPLPFKDGKPDFDEQKHIVAYLDNIQQKAQTLQKLQEETEMEIERLRESILHKAFRGEL